MKNRHFLFLLFTLWVAAAQAQLTLGTSPYSQTFDNIGTGLPTGWTVRTGASASSRGTTASFNTAEIAWSSTTGAFNNYASAEGLTSTANTTQQNNSTDRVPGVRQSGSFGDPGAAFELAIANTTGKTDFQLQIKHQTLVNETRTTTYTVQFTTNAAGTSGWTNLGTYSTGTFGSTTANYNLPSTFNNVMNTVYIRVVALTASTGSGSRDVYAIDDVVLSWTTTPAPVTLQNFAARLQNRLVEISWQTAQETDNAFFALERSADGLNFAEIVRVPGAGDSREQRDYRFTDEKPLNGSNYYRLRQVDTDGRTTYSSILAVNLGTNRSFNLYPSPASGTVTFELDQPLEESAAWEVLDRSGRVLLQGTMAAESKISTLDVSALPAGSYVVRITRGTEVLNRVLTKQ